MANRGGRVIGPAMSPLPSDDEQGQTFGPAMSPLPSESETHLPNPNVPADQPTQSGNKKKKRKKRRRKGSDSDMASPGAGATVPAGMTGEEAQPAPEPTKKKRKKKRSRGRQPEHEAEDEDEVVIQDTQPEPQLVDMAEQYQSPKRSSRKKLKQSAIHETQDDESPHSNGMQEYGSVNGEAGHRGNEFSQFGALYAQDASPSVSPQQASEVLQSPFSQMQRKRASKRTEVPSSDAQQLLVSHAIGGSPSSARQNTVDPILEYKPVAEDDAADDAIIASSQSTRSRRGNTQSQASAIRSTQIKTEDLNDDNALPMHSHFFGIDGPSFADATRDRTTEVTRGNDPESLAWLHKRDAPDGDDTLVMNTRANQPRELDAALPDLHPRQVKTEREADPGSNSESDSPSAARFDRLSTSRSRSASRASTSRAVWLADQDLGLGRTARYPPRSMSRGTNRSSLSNPGADRSTTGSNASIPADIEVKARPFGDTSRSNSRSPPMSAISSENDAGADGDAMGRVAQSPGIDEPDVSHNDTHRNSGTVSDRAKTVEQQQSERRSDNEISNGNAHRLANQMETQPVQKDFTQDCVSEGENHVDDTTAVEDEAGTVQHQNQLRSIQKRKAKPSLVPVVDTPSLQAVSRPDLGAETAQLASQPQMVEKRSLHKEVLQPVSRTAMDIEYEDPEANDEPSASENVTALRDDSAEPGHSVSQPQPRPKGKKKRKLQQQKTLSLSQLEGDEDAVEGQSRLSGFSQKAMSRSFVGSGNNEPELQEVGTLNDPAQAQISRKAKRKRRTANDASDAEMDNVLAAGPSNARKKRSSKLGVSDTENGRAVKRTGRQSKVSTGERATGPWTTEELGALGRVVDEFRNANSMTQHEINELIHQVPNKADPINHEFWNRADISITGRTRKQITERARRLYHNFVARGTWTEEQKDELHELLREHGSKTNIPWTEIAGKLNRDSKDVRDYWRNHYLVHETQVKSRWSKEEEERLKEVVEEALSKIRIMRENNDQFRPRPRASGIDDEALLDWQQISAAMGLTRSRQQCKWKWIDMREKGRVGDESIVLPTQPRSSAGGSGKFINGISEELSNAREDYRGMSEEDKFRLIDAIHDSGARNDGHIRWSSLVDERFRVKWKRPTLKLVWYRLRQIVPDYDSQNVEENAQYLVNYYHQHQAFPRVDDHQVSEQAEMNLVHRQPGNRVWKRVSGNVRAIRERQRRSSSASSRASSRLSSRVSSEILRIEGSDEEGHDQEEGVAVDLDDLDDNGQRHVHQEDVPIRIPDHLTGEAAMRARAQARGNGKKSARGARSASVALDSDSD